MSGLIVENIKKHLRGIVLSREDADELKQFIESRVQNWPEHWASDKKESQH